MKKIFHITLLLICTAIVNAQMQAPKINFEVKEHNFGKINESDGNATYIFKFNNIGNQPLLLQNVQASCGCTTPKWSKEPILPNSEGTIEVSYNPRNRPGAFKKTIVVTTNTDPAKVYLTIQGTVSPREKTVEEKFPFMIGTLRCQKSHFSFFNITNTTIKDGTVMVVNTTSQPIHVTFPSLPAHITAQDAIIPAGKEGLLRFTYDANKKDDWGYVSDNIYCWVDGSKASSAIKLSATITEDFSKLSVKQRSESPIATLSSRKSDFGTVRSGELVNKTFTITNTGKSALIIHSVKSSSSTVKCQIDQKKIAPGKTAEVTILLDTKKTRGKQYKTVNIISNDCNSPTLNFTLSGVVK